MKMKAGRKKAAATMRGPTTWYSPLMKIPRCDAMPIAAPAAAMTGIEGISIVLDGKEL